MTEEQWEEAKRLVRSQGVVHACMGMDAFQLNTFMQYVQSLEVCVNHIQERMDKDYDDMMEAKWSDTYD